MFNFKPFPPYVFVPRYDPNNYLKFLADSKPLFFTKNQIAITMEE